MKVIEIPNKKCIEWTKKITCPMCGALLEYNNLDVEKINTKFNELEDALKCGYCHEYFTI